MLYDMQYDRTSSLLIYGISGTTTIIVAPLTTIINQFKADAIRYGISCVNCTEVSSDLSAFKSRYDPLEIDLYIYLYPGDPQPASREPGKQQASDSPLFHRLSGI